MFGVKRIERPVRKSFSSVLIKALKIVEPSRYPIIEIGEAGRAPLDRSRIFKYDRNTSNQFLRNSD